jgi:hypothetical protein
VSWVGSGVAGVVGQEAVRALGARACACSVVRRACQRPRPTRRDVHSVAVTEAIAPQSVIVPMVEDA